MKIKSFARFGDDLPIEEACKSDRGCLAKKDLGDQKEIPTKSIFNRTSAIDAFMTLRRIVPNDQDNPSIHFPRSGTYMWEEREHYDGKDWCVACYYASSEDKAWLLEKDQNYLERIERSNELKEKEPAVWFLREKDKADKGYEVDIRKWWAAKLDEPNFEQTLAAAEEAVKQMQSQPAVGETTVMINAKQPKPVSQPKARVAPVQAEAYKPVAEPAKEAQSLEVKQTQAHGFGRQIRDKSEYPVERKDLYKSSTEWARARDDYERNRKNGRNIDAPIESKNLPGDGAYEWLIGSERVDKLGQLKRSQLAVWYLRAKEGDTDDIGAWWKKKLSPPNLAKILEQAEKERTPEAIEKMEQEIKLRSQQKMAASASTATDANKPVATATESAQPKKEVQPEQVKQPEVMAEKQAAPVQEQKATFMPTDSIPGVAKQSQPAPVQKTPGTYFRTDKAEYLQWSVLWGTPDIDITKALDDYKQKQQYANDIPGDGTYTWKKGEGKGKYVYGDKERDGDNYEYEVQYIPSIADKIHILYTAIKHFNSNEEVQRLITAESDAAKRLELVNFFDPVTGETPLTMAVMYGDQRAVELLIAAGAKIDSPNKNGFTPLYIAASQGVRVEVLQVLLESKPSPNLNLACGEHAATPLYVAAYMGCKSVMKELLEHGANINLVARGGHTPLHAAAHQGHREIIDILLDKGAHINAQNGDGETPLFLAAKNGHFEALKVLLEYGADLELPNKKGETPLSIASQSGHKKVVQVLRKTAEKRAAKMKTQSFGTVVGSLGASERLSVLSLREPPEVTARFEFMKKRLNALEDINETDGRSLVSEMPSDGEIKWLKGKREGGDVCGVINGDHYEYEVRYNPGAKKIEWMEERDKDYLRRIKAKGKLDELQPAIALLYRLEYPSIRIGATDDIGVWWGEELAHPSHLEHLRQAELVIAGKSTRLFLAAYLGKEKVVTEELSKADVVIDFRNENNATPLFAAAAHGSLEIVKALLAKGAKVDLLRNGGFTALYVAALNGHKDVVEELIKHKADINLCTKDGETPLYAAALKGHKDIVDELIKHKADVNLCTKDGMTPLYAAASGGRLDIVNALIEGETGTWKSRFVSRKVHSGLWIATLGGRLEVIHPLLNAGAHLNRANNTGATPLFVPVHNNKLEVVKALLKAGAKTEIAYQKETPLFAAVKNGQIEIVKELLDAGADVFFCKEDGVTPLHVAAQNGNIAIVKMLLEADARVDSLSQDGITPLRLAAKNGHAEVANLLYAKTLELNETLKTPLDRKPTSMKMQKSGKMVYSRSNNAEVPGSFIEVLPGKEKYFEYLKGALEEYKKSRENGDVQDEKEIGKFPSTGTYTLEVTPEAVYVKYQESAEDRAWMEEKDKNYLRRIKAEGNLNKLQPAIAHLYELDYPNEEDRKANDIGAWWAEKLKRRDLPQLLEQVDLVLNKQPVLLHTFVEYGNRTLIEEAIAAGADVNARDAHGNTPLTLAVMSGNKAVVEALLLTDKANPNLPDKKGYTPLYHAIQAMVRSVSPADKEQAESIIALLIDNKANVDERMASEEHPNETITLLYIAAYSLLPDVLAKMLEYKADANFKTENGRTALHALANSPASVNEKDKRIRDIIKQLVDAGASIDAQTNDGETPLFVAAQKGNLIAVKAFIDAKARVDLGNKDGVTPLHIAAQNGNVELVELLLKSGADINAVNKDGETPLHMAAEKGHRGVVERLLYAKPNPNVDAIRKDGKMPLLLAVQNGHLDVVRELIPLLGIENVNFAAHDGSTPLSVAEQSNHKNAKQIASLLRMAGATEVEVKQPQQMPSEPAKEAKQVEPAPAKPTIEALDAEEPKSQPVASSIVATMAEQTQDEKIAQYEIALEKAQMGRVTNIKELSIAENETSVARENFVKISEVAKGIKESEIGAELKDLEKNYDSLIKLNEQRYGQIIGIIHNENFSNADLKLELFAAKKEVVLQEIAQLQAMIKQFVDQKGGKAKLDENERNILGKYEAYCGFIEKQWRVLEIRLSPDGTNVKIVALSDELSHLKESKAKNLTTHLLELQQKLEVVEKEEGDKGLTQHIAQQKFLQSEIVATQAKLKALTDAEMTPLPAPSDLHGLTLARRIADADGIRTIIGNSDRSVRSRELEERFNAAFRCLCNDKDIDKLALEMAATVFMCHYNEHFLTAQYRVQMHAKGPQRLGAMQAVSIFPDEPEEQRFAGDLTDKLFVIKYQKDQAWPSIFGAKDTIAEIKVAPNATVKQMSSCVKSLNATRNETTTAMGTYLLMLEKAVENRKAKIKIEDLEAQKSRALQLLTQLDKKNQELRALIVKAKDSLDKDVIANLEKQGILIADIDKHLVTAAGYSNDVTCVVNELKEFEKATQKDETAIAEKRKELAALITNMQEAQVKTADYVQKTMDYFFTKLSSCVKDLTVIVVKAQTQEDGIAAIQKDREIRLGELTKLEAENADADKKLANKRTEIQQGLEKSSNELSALESKRANKCQEFTATLLQVEEQQKKIKEIEANLAKISGEERIKLLQDLVVEIKKLHELNQGYEQQALQLKDLEYAVATAVSGFMCYCTEAKETYASSLNAEVTKRHDEIARLKGKLECSAKWLEQKRDRVRKDKAERQERLSLLQADIKELTGLIKLALNLPLLPREKVQEAKDILQKLNEGAVQIASDIKLFESHEQTLTETETSLQEISDKADRVPGAPKSAELGVEGTVSRVQSSEEQNKPTHPPVKELQEKLEKYQAFTAAASKQFFARLTACDQELIKINSEVQAQEQYATERAQKCDEVAKELSLLQTVNSEARTMLVKARFDASQQLELMEKNLMDISGSVEAKRVKLLRVDDAVVAQHEKVNTLFAALDTATEQNEKQLEKNLVAEFVILNNLQKEYSQRRNEIVLLLQNFAAARDGFAQAAVAVKQAYDASKDALLQEQKDQENELRGKLAIYSEWHVAEQAKIKTAKKEREEKVLKLTAEIKELTALIGMALELPTVTENDVNIKIARENLQKLKTEAAKTQQEIRKLQERDAELEADKVTLTDEVDKMLAAGQNLAAFANEVTASLQQGVVAANEKAQLENQKIVIVAATEEMTEKAQQNQQKVAAVVTGTLHHYVEELANYEREVIPQADLQEVSAAEKLTANEARKRVLQNAQERCERMMDSIQRVRPMVDASVAEFVAHGEQNVARAGNIQDDLKGIETQTGLLRKNLGIQISRLEKANEGIRNELLAAAQGFHEVAKLRDTALAAAIVVFEDILRHALVKSDEIAELSSEVQWTLTGYKPLAELEPSEKERLRLFYLELAYLRRELATAVATKNDRPAGSTLVKKTRDKIRSLEEELGAIRVERNKGIRANRFERCEDILDDRRWHMHHDQYWIWPLIWVGWVLEVGAKLGNWFGYRTTSFAHYEDEYKTVELDMANSPAKYTKEGYDNTGYYNAVVACIELNDDQKAQVETIKLTYGLIAETKITGIERIEEKIAELKGRLARFKSALSNFDQIAIIDAEIKELKELQAPLARPKADLNQFKTRVETDRYFIFNQEELYNEGNRIIHNLEKFEAIYDSKKEKFELHIAELDGSLKALKVKNDALVQTTAADVRKREEDIAKANEPVLQEAPRPEPQKYPSKVELLVDLPPMPQELLLQAEKEATAKRKMDMQNAEMKRAQEMQLVVWQSPMAFAPKYSPVLQLKPSGQSSAVDAEVQQNKSGDMPEKGSIVDSTVQKKAKADG